MEAIVLGVIVLAYFGWLAFGDWLDYKRGEDDD